MQTYDLKPSNATAIVPGYLLNAWRSTLDQTGMTSAQSFTVAMTLFYADPGSWDLETTQANKPKQANFHVRIPGLIGTWIEEIRTHLDRKRLSSGSLSIVTKTDVITACMTYYIELCDNGELMSTMGRQNRH